MNLEYKDTATFYRVTAGGYRGDKTVAESASVDVIFLQNTGFEQGSFQENTDSDAVCYPDPLNTFISGNFNRLQGMYILMPLFGASDDESWFKVVSVNVNRDHLLANEIDNIDMQLKKTRPLQGVS